MAKFQQQRGNVLNAEERAKSARKCLQLLSEPRIAKERWSLGDIAMFDREYGYAQSFRYAPSEHILQWLRDMVGRYVT